MRRARIATVVQGIAENQDVSGKQLGEVLELAYRHRLLEIEADRRRVSADLARALRSIGCQLFDVGFQFKDLLEEIGLSASWLSSRFKSELHCKPYDYLSRHRMSAAKELLRLSDAQIGEVAGAVGFKSPSAFSKAFVRREGVSPLQFRADCEAERGKVLSGSHFKDIEGRAFELIWPDLAHRCETRRLSPSDLVYRVNPSIFVQELIRKCLEDCRANRREGVEFGRLALDVLWVNRDLIPKDEYVNLAVEVYSQLGNLQRLAADLPGAEQSFAEAEKLLEEHEASISAKASFLALKGHLRTCQRRFSEALELLRKASALKQVAGERWSALRIAAAQGYALELMGCLDTAIETYESAISAARSEEDADAPVVAMLYSRLASALASKGDFAVAESNIAKAVDLIGPNCDETSLLPIRWIEAIIAFNDGKVDRAESILKDVRDGLQAAGEDINAALVEIDLATLCLSEGRLKDACVLVLEALPVFKGAGLSQESASAVEILQHSIGTRRLEVSLLRELRSQVSSVLGSVPGCCLKA